MSRKSRRAKRARARQLGIVSIVGPDGKSHRYLNSAVPQRRDGTGPIAPLEKAICQGKCGYGYSHLMHQSDQCQCEECRLEKSMHRAAALERLLNISLGATNGSYDPIEARRTYLPDHDQPGRHKRILPLASVDDKDSENSDAQARPDRRRGRAGDGVD
jgi:hypothetical protein